MSRFLKYILLILANAGIYFVLERFFSVDTPVRHIHFCYAQPFLVFVSVIFGPVVGGFGIALGYYFIQLGSGVFDWIAIVCAFLNCFFIGFAMRNVDLRNEYFGRRIILQFSTTQTVSNFICWGVFYPLISYFILHGNIFELLEQGFWKALGNFLSCLLASTLFLLLYARSQFSEANFYRN